MSKKLIVLANSFKHLPERCVAGRTIVEKGKRYEIGEWVRPINPARNEGALQPADILVDGGQMVAVWDYVSISEKGSANDVLQPENVIIDGTQWKLLNGLFQRCGLDLLVEKPSDLWLQPGARTDRVSHGYLEQNPPSQSLYCIRPERLHLKFFTNAYGKSRRRAVFLYRGVAYDLGLTDPVACDTYCRRMPGKDDEAYVEEIDVRNVLLCVSLAGVYEGYHYKLVATVLQGS